MKKLLFYCCCLGLFLNSHSAGAQSIIIGAGASSGTATNAATGDSGPMYRSSGTSNFIYSRHHYLYTQAELVAAGLPTGAQITEVAWNKDNAAASSAPYLFEIWMQNSTLTTGRTAPQTWAALTTGATQVYNNAATNLPAAIGYVNHLLAAPFTYTGDGLEISVNYDHSSTSSPWSTLGVSWTRDAISNRTLSYCGSTAGTNLSNARTVRPQIRITYTTGPCVSPPTAGTTTTSLASICAGTNITLALTGNSSGTGQTYQLESAATSVGTYTSVGTSSSAPSNTIAPTTTSWYRYAVTCGTQTVYSSPVQVIVAPLFPAGTYTINSAVTTGGTNFQTFNDAVTALTCGIAGPIVFNVVTGSGPYNERVVIPHIPTTSATNTITFNGNGATLTYAATLTGERGTLTLDGADYITVNNLKIVATGTTYGAGVHMMNDADNNTINACDISVNSTTTGSGHAGIAISGSATSYTTTGSDCDSNTISNNIIDGGYYSITLLGTGTTSQVYANKITGNTITNFYYYGLYLNGNFGLLVENNDISRPTRTTNSVFYGMYITTGVIGGNFNRNKLHNSCGGQLTNTSSQYCIYLLADGTTAAPNIFSNNLVYDINGRGAAYAFYKSGADNAKIVHNTFSMDYINATAATTAVGGFYQTAVHSGLDFSNNIITVGRNSTGTRYAVYVATATATFTGNNNDYFISGTTGTSGIGYYASAARTTLAAWQTATSQDAASVSINPVYAAVATGDYEPTATTLDDLGAPRGIATDISNMPRSATTPDIGAYEFGNTPCPPVTSLVASAVTANSATLTWNVVTGITGYEYVLNNTATAPTGAGTATAATTHNPTTLTPSTIYYMHVRTHCGGTDFSTWVTIPFTTQCLVNPTAVITPAGPTTVCDPATVILNANTGTGLTYQWKNGTTDIPGATNASYTATASGNYTVVVSSGPCNATSASVTVAINPLPTAVVNMIPASGNICGGSADLTVGSSTGVTYQWYRDNFAIPGATANTHSATVAGVYTVVVTNTATGCSTLSSASVVRIVAPPVATISPTGNITLCTGDSVLLSGSFGTGYTYQWKLGTVNAPGAATGIDYTAKQAGDYTLTVTANGCSATSSITTITIQSRPLAVMSPSSPSMACDELILSSTNTNVNFQWMYNNLPILGANNATYSAPTSGNYSLRTISTINGCSAESPAVAITINESPSATITYSSPLNFCAGGAVVLNTYNNSSSNFTYEWSDSGTPIPGADDFTYVVNDAGSYTVKVVNTVTGCQGASQPVIVSVHPLPLPVVTYSNNTLSTTQPYALYQWVLDNQHIGGAIQRNYAPVAPGAYHVIVTDENGCTNLSEIRFVNNVGVKHTAAGKAIQIYPNPTSGMLFVKSDIEVNLHLRDVTGKVVLNGNNASGLNLESVADGMYMLHITDKTGQLIRVEKISKSAR
jgi:hypothetical protein